ncbi:MAG: Calx-beta domain-containing protein, partial [Planctomycetota bacterium]
MIRFLSFCVVLVLAMVTTVPADLYDDFGESQSGSWAPARWWDDYACRGRFLVPAKSSPKLDVAFTRGNRVSEINAAGGFSVEVEVVEIRGKWAAVNLGAGEVGQAAVAVVVYPDNSSSADQIYIYGNCWDIGHEFDEAEKVRIEIDTDDVSEKDVQASVSVVIGDTQVVAGYTFRWQKTPSALHLAAGEAGRAAFDNLRIELAGPVIEFEQSASVDGECGGPAVVNVALRHPLPGETYTVDYAVTGGTAKGAGVDHAVENGTLTFEPGQK